MVHSKNWTKYKTEHFQKDNKVSKLYNKQTVTVGRLLEGQHKSVFFKNTARSKKLYSTTLLSAISFCVTVEIVELLEEYKVSIQISVSMEGTILHLFTSVNFLKSV